MPSSGALGGILLVWDTKVATRVDVLVGVFSLFVMLDFKGRVYWWVSTIYGLTNLMLRSFFFWEEISFVHGLCSPHCCVGVTSMLCISLLRS